MRMAFRRNSEDHGLKKEIEDGTKHAQKLCNFINELMIQERRESESKDRRIIQGNRYDLDIILCTDA